MRDGIVGEADSRPVPGRRLCCSCSDRRTATGQGVPRTSYKGWICFRACETADAGVNSTLAWFVISRLLTIVPNVQFKQYVLAPLWVDFYFREQARHFELVPSRETASSGSQLG